MPRAAVLTAGRGTSGLTGERERVMRAITPADRDRYPFHESIAAKYGK